LTYKNACCKKTLFQTKEQTNVSTDLTTARKQVLENLIKPKENTANETDKILQAQPTRNFAKRMFRHGLQSTLINENQAFVARNRRLSGF